MVELFFSEDEIALILQFEIEDYEIFDATGMRASEWKEAIQGTDYRVIANASPCREHGHTLRTRPGHCAVCNPRNLAIQDRHYEDGEIYLAYSESKQLSKIGVSKSTYNRIKSLNSQSYANANDWVMLFSKRVDSSAYNIESEIHQKLSKYQVKIIFSRSFGVSETSREVFSCDPSFGIKVIEDAIEKHEQMINEFLKKYL